MIEAEYQALLKSLEQAPIVEEDLSPEELAELNEYSAEIASPDAHENGVWTQEIVRRVLDLRAGRVTTITAEEAFAHARSRLRSVRG